MKRILLIIICITSITNTLQAQTTFVATADAFDWSVGSSWEGGISPGATINTDDTVIIPIGTSIIITQNTLTTNNGTIQIDGRLEIGVNGSIITNNGNLYVNGRLTYNQNSGFTNDDSIINNGEIIVSGAIDQISDFFIPKQIRVNSGGSLLITPTGSVGVDLGEFSNRFLDLNIINDGFIENQGNIGRTRILTNLTGSVFINQGSLFISNSVTFFPIPELGIATFTNHGAFVNSGTFLSLISQGGDTDKILEHVNTGTFTVTATGEFTMRGFGDTHTFTSAAAEAGTSSFVNDGFTTIEGGATLINGVFGDPEVDLLDNNNQFFIEPGAELINYGNFDTFVTFNNGTLTNRGTTNVDIFLNNGHLGNSGFFNLVGGGFNSDGSPNTIDNSGVIRVTSGSFNLTNTTMHVSRTLRVEFGFFIINENSTLTYDNTTAPNGVFWIFDIQNFTVNGTLTIVEGTLINDAAITNNGTIDNQAFFINNAQFDNNGTFLNSGGMSQNEIPGETEVSRLDNFGTVTNTGELLFNTRMNNFEGSITNSGTLTYNDGGANFGAAIITNTNTGEIAMNSGSITNLETATLDNFGAITINNATLNNQGLLNNSGAITHTGAFNNLNNGNLVGINTNHTGNFTNQANLSPGNTTASTGTYSLNNDYTHTANATLNIEIENTTEFDNVAIAGTANLSGALSVTLPTGFVPLGGETFTILTANTVSGTFDTTNLANLPTQNDQIWEINYYPTNVTLTVVTPCEFPVLFNAQAQEGLCLDAGIQTDLSGGLPMGGIYSGPGVTDEGDGMTYSFDPILAGAGTHTITYNFTDTNGCIDFDSDTIEVIDIPTVSFTAPENLPVDAGIQSGLSGGTPAVSIVSTTLIISAMYRRGPLPISALLSGTIVFDGSGTMLSTDLSLVDIPTNTEAHVVNASVSGSQQIILQFDNGAFTGLTADSTILGASGNVDILGGFPIPVNGFTFDFVFGTLSATTDLFGSSIYAGPGVIDDGNGVTYSFDPAVAGVGTHIIEYTFTEDNVCAVTASDTITVYCEIDVSFNAQEALCIDAPIQTDLSGGFPVGGIYAGPGVIDEGDGMTYSFDPVVAGAGTHTITYSFTNTNGCIDLASDTIEVFALPNVIFTAPLLPLCIDAGVQTNLSGGTVVGGIYSGTGITDDGDGMTYSFDPLVAGIGIHVITYEVIDTNGCSNAAIDTIEVVALPIVTFTAPEDLSVDAGIQTGLSGGTPSVSMLSTTVTIVIDYEVDGFQSFIAGNIVFNSSGTMVSTDVTANNDANGSITNLVDATALDATITLDFGNGSIGTIVADAPIIGASGSLTFSGSNLVIDGDVFDFFSGTGIANTPGTSIYSGPGVINNGNGTTYSFDPAVAGVGTHIIEYTFTDANGCAVTTSDTIEVFVNLCTSTTTYTIAGGWDNGTPTTATRAIIAEDYNTSTMGLGDINACELIINMGATLTVTDGNFINVENNITISGTLDVANTGSVVQVDENAVTINNGSIAVAKTTPTIDDRNFVAMSSPVTAEARDRVYGNSRAVFSIIPSNFVPFAIDFVEFPEFEFAENFLDDNNDYLLPVTGSTALPDAGIGQLIFPQPEPNVGDGAYTLTYTQDAMNPGTLNSGTISVPINYNGPATTNNYNLFGNPYASAIDVTAFITANDAVNEVYYWDHITNPTSELPGFGTSNFSMNDVSIRNAMMGIAAVNGGTAPGQFMASGQGFGIKADQVEMMDNTPVVFTNSIRVTGNNDGFRNSETQTGIDKLWLNLTTTAFDEAIAQTGIGFTPDATPAIDKGYDSPRMGTFLSLFTTVDSGELLGIQSREAFDLDMEIALGFSTSIEEATPYTISIDTLEGIAIENASVFIIDHFLNTIVNLNEQVYTFTAQKGLHTDRFTIVFQDREVLDTDEDSFRESKINLYPNPSQGQVTLAYAGTSTLENAVITDINGKIIKHIDLTNFNQTQTMDLGDLARGMYFMQVTSQENTVIKKLILR